MDSDILIDAVSTTVFGPNAKKLPKKPSKYLRIQASFEIYSLLNVVFVNPQNIREFSWQEGEIVTLSKLRNQNGNNDEDENVPENTENTVKKRKSTVCDGQQGYSNVSSRAHW